MSVTLGEAFARAVAYLRERAVREARRDAELLVCRAAGVDRARLYSHPEMPLDPARFHRLLEDLERRGTGYPLQYLLGSQEFYGREFVVSEAVLIPRPETEVVVELALELLTSTPAPAVLDVGTGRKQRIEMKRSLGRHPAEKERMRRWVHQQSF
ncbi:MAG: hypothetical protein Kow001_12980 [Acidobacteriota bacterium]